MELANRLVNRWELGILPLVLMFLLSTLTLLFSMIVAGRLVSGIDFGPLSLILVKGAGLLLVVNLLHLLTVGLLIAAPVWYFGLMFLFDLDRRQTATLTKINWGMMVVWKLLLLVLML